MTPRDAMAVGTAGYTAMLAVIALERHGITPDRGPVIVTGAAGGVGSVAISILSGLGYHVIASTGRKTEHDYLTGLGAAEIIAREDLSGPAKPLAKERWAGGIDSVGSHTLANVLSMTSYGGAIAACGLAQGMDLPASVAPFILRGVSLLGIDSVMAPMAIRLEAWRRIAHGSRSREARRTVDADRLRRHRWPRRMTSSTARSAAASWSPCENPGQPLKCEQSAESFSNQRPAKLFGMTGPLVERAMERSVDDASGECRKRRHGSTSPRRRSSRRSRPGRRGPCRSRSFRP